MLVQCAAPHIDSQSYVCVCACVFGFKNEEVANCFVMLRAMCALMLQYLPAFFSTLS